jgi:NAD(P)H dehydrogenase (quinone)
MTEAEYLRDAYYNEEPPLADDVIAEQEKINSSDAIVFIYPIFWTEAPVKLVGWFDRVWTFGFAYGNKRMKFLEKALILATAGSSLDHLENLGLLDGMKNVMLKDRLFEKVKQSDFIIFDEMSREKETRNTKWEKNLERAYLLGKEFFIQK